jgi:hypothetical protein
MMFEITCGAQVDADGSGRAYGPNDTGLDFTANAGEPGDWWGVKTDTGKSSGKPLVNPGNGLWISDTSLHLNGQPINAEIVPGIVVPKWWAESVEGVVLGCRGEMTFLDTGITANVVVFDIGPNFGEASIAAHIVCRNLGSEILNDIDALRALVRHGGISKYSFRYQIYPGVPAPGFNLQPF